MQGKRQKRQNYNSKFKTFYFLVVLFTFYFLLFTFRQAEAQTSLPLTVAPSRQDLTVDPGEKTAINIKFFNRGDAPVSGILRVADFIVEDKEGSPTFIEGPTQLSPRFAAASWVSLPYDRITIAPKDRVLIQAKITTPSSASPGGRYFAVYFEPGGTPAPPSGALKEAASPVAVRIASLVYLRVAGPITENARLVQFTAPKFLEYGPIPITTEVLNLGNYHIRPKGTITITSLFGKVIDQQILKEENIFPDASRVYKNNIGQKWMFGKYRADLNLSYGETGKALTGTVFMWVFPWKVVIAILLAILVLVLVIALLYNRLRRREEELEEKIEELEEKLEKKD